MQPMGYGGAPPMNAPPGGGYEFGPFENDTIESVAKFARWWGILSLVGGALLVLFAIGMAGVGAMHAVLPESSAAQAGSLGAISAVVGMQALVFLSVGVFYLKSGGALRSVVDTQGNDIELLMNAMRTMKRAFQIEAIATVAGFFLGFILNIIIRVANSR
jgi:hypothetical protein